MAYAIQVMVVNKSTRKGLSGHTVKLYGSDPVKTDNSGMATLITNSSSVEVYVNGTTVYAGYASSAPNPIIYEKS